MKKLFCLLLCFLMLLGLTACGADEKPTDSSDTALAETSSVESEVSSEQDFSSEQENSSNTKSNTTSKNTNSGKINGSSDKKQNENTSVATSSGKRYPTKQKAIQIRRANQSWFKKVGRCDVSGYSGIGLNWSCASLEFDVDCTDDLALEFVKGSGDRPVYVEIYVDGKIIADRTKIEASGTLTIAEGLEPGVHRVKIVRQSDCECPSITLTKVYAYGALVTKAPEDRPLYIEAIGDANLIGWGVRLDDAFYKDYSSEKQSTARNRENEDGTLSYAYVAAEKLNADSYIFAKQGVGIAATYHKTTEKVNGVQTTVGSARAGLLPTMYQYTSPSGNIKYTPTRQPDIIVIDAGSADLSASCQATALDGDSVGINTARAGKISTDFLKSLKVQNPDAKIIWCYGLTNSDPNLEKYVKDAIEDAGGEAKGIYSLKLTTSTRNGYPSAKEHAAAADVLANKIKSIIK